MVYLSIHIQKSSRYVWRWKNESDIFNFQYHDLQQKEKI